MDRLTALLTPAEHLVISRWLGVQPLVVRPGLTAKQALARVLRGVEIADFLESLEDRSKAAVAAILLKHVQHRLPQWASVRSDSDGKKQVTLGRRPRRPRGEPSLEPRFLFGINWATSGPGFSWPAVYTVTYVRGYGRYVVTESLDCVDVRGACDVALGSFPAGRDLLAACREIVMSDWSMLSFDGQTRFEQVTDFGLFDSDAIGKMANEVWGSEDDEEPEDDEAEEDEDDEEAGEEEVTGRARSEAPSVRVALPPEPPPEPPPDPLDLAPAAIDPDSMPEPPSDWTDERRHRAVACWAAGLVREWTDAECPDYLDAVHTAQNWCSGLAASADLAAALEAVPLPPDATAPLMVAGRFHDARRVGAWRACRATCEPVAWEASFLAIMAVSAAVAADAYWRAGAEETERPGAYGREALELAGRVQRQLFQVRRRYTAPPSENAAFETVASAR